MLNLLDYVAEILAQILKKGELDKVILEIGASFKILLGDFNCLNWSLLTDVVYLFGSSEFSLFDLYLIPKQFGVSPAKLQVSWELLKITNLPNPIILIEFNA